MLKKRKNNTLPTVIPFMNCPAKTFYDSNGMPQLGRSVFNHCQIVGAVAKELIHRSGMKHLYPPGASFTAATHDIGKVSPTFYNKLHQACNLPILPGFNAALEKNWGGHAGVSQLTAKALNAPEYIPEILGQHHGFSPNVSSYKATSEVFGEHPWQDERQKLVDALQLDLNESWSKVINYATARLLSGLTSVADWIGSGQHFEDPSSTWQLNIGKALDEAGFIQPVYKTGLSFEQVFGFTPRLAQRLLVDQVSQPGAYVLEAPMGLGKTEAALYAAYKMLSAGKASGVYFALPTQLTSNKIYERFNLFLEKILSESCKHRSLLLHANAWLLDTEMGEEGRPGGAWFNQAKRGLLAPFAVGTIDQALMAVMNVKHGFVRAYGLSGKVVILDEVHTYDVYTGTLLEALIALLVQLDCTVIVLSATLNQERRQALLGVATHSSAYPLITAFPQLALSVTEVPVPVRESRDYAVLIQNKEQLATEEVLLRAEQGQQVLWIENTVKEAQQKFLELAARACEAGIDCGLLHSRFTLFDREKNEKEWVNIFGKPGWKDKQRSLKGRILIGTQVLEQSLDIDADFLVSRFAPTDMLLQRFGRLWRHHETPRNKHAKPEAWLLAPNLHKSIEQPEIGFGASAYVYSPYVLARSLEVWQPIKKINLPGDIRPLVEATYHSREEEGKMAKLLHDLTEGSRHRIGQNTLRQLARVGLAQAGRTLPESKAQTRYSESESVEVLLLKNIRYDIASQAGVLTLLDGEQIYLPHNRVKLNYRQWRRIAIKLMRQIVHVRPNDAPKQVNRELLKQFGLHHCFYLGNPVFPEDESLLRIALVDDSDQLRGIENLRLHDKYSIEYRHDLGYRLIKN